MKRRNAWMYLGIVLLVLVAGCTLYRETDPTPNPSLDVVDDPGQIEPPPAMLSIGGEEQTSGIGSFCWNANAQEGGTVALCADTIGIPTAHQPLPASSPFTARFELPVEQTPQELALTAMAVSDQDEMESGPAQWRWWPYGEGVQQSLPLEQDPALELSLDPGLYVLSLFARWPEHGDVTYGFLVEVAPSTTSSLPPGGGLSPLQLPMAMKGYELYSWSSDQGWYFTLTTGTNRLKTIEELTMGQDIVEKDWVKITAMGASDLKAALARLPVGVDLVWWGARDLPSSEPIPAVTLTLPPSQLVDDVRSYCAELGLQLDVIR